MIRLLAWTIMLLLNITHFPMLFWKWLNILCGSQSKFLPALFLLSLGEGAKKLQLRLKKHLFHPTGMLILFTNRKFPPYLYQPRVAMNYSFKLPHQGSELGCNSFQLNWRWSLKGSSCLCSVYIDTDSQKKITRNAQTNVFFPHGHNLDFVTLGWVRACPSHPAELQMKSLWAFISSFYIPGLWWEEIVSCCTVIFWMHSCPLIFQYLN